MLAVSAAAGISTGLLIGGWLGVLAGMVVASFITNATNLATEAWVRWRHPQQPARIDTPARCPVCPCTDHGTAKTLRKPIPCRKCGQTAVRFSSGLINRPAA